MVWKKNNYDDYNGYNEEDNYLDYDKEYKDYDKDFDKDYEEEYKNYTKDSSLDSDFNDEDEEEVEVDTINPDTVDKDIMGYFVDARVTSKRSTTFKKKKKEKITYQVGQAIFLTNKKCNATIVYGPYELDKKQMYEVELDNTVISVEERHIKIID